MALETGTYISDLVSTNPVGTDTLDKADDHLRLIKSTVKATFPNITGVVNATHTELNNLESLIDSTNGRGFLRNRVINGDCRIDQRNAGASITPTINATYALDRWVCALSVTSKYSIQQNAGAVTPPAGYKYYLGITSLSNYAVPAGEAYYITQKIEGHNAADFGFGAAGAQAVTLSFWVRSSLTGTFGGAIHNSAYTRSYPFTYSISAANTWEQKTITIPGDTSGTWVTDTGIGIAVNFNLGTGATNSGTAGAWAATGYVSATGATSIVGTNAATWYVTGVQLEAGSAATPFERRQYGQELALCQRYYQKSYGQGFTPGTNTVLGVRTGYFDSGSLTRLFIHNGTLAVHMRNAPTVSFWSEDGTANNVSLYNTNTSKLAISSAPATSNETIIGGFITTSTSGTAGTPYYFHFTASAEL
jgi:hypothetical protein